MTTQTAQHIVPAPAAATAVDAELRRRLARLRQGIRRYVMLEALSWTAVVSVVLVAVSFVLDYSVRMNVPQRGVILALGLAVVGYVLWRLLWRPLRRPLRDEDLGLLLEQHNPQLEDRLITTLQLVRKQAGAGFSRELLDVVAEQAREAMRGISVTAPLNREHLRKRLLYGLMAAAILGLAWAVRTEWMSIWFRRNVLLQSVEWPHRTYLTVVGFKDRAVRVVRGSELTIEVRASGARIPQSVRFDLQFASSGRFRESVERGAGNQYSKKFFNVIEPFTFTVSGGDYRSELHRVDVVDPPLLSSMEFACEYPAYTALPPKRFGAGEGGLDAVVGTWITLSAVSNKPLRGGKLLLGGRPVAPLEIEEGRRLKARWQLRDPQADSGVLRFVLTDAEGLTSDAYSYPLTALPDRPPLVKLQTTGIGDRITPNARVPLEIEASDDYGVRQTQLVFGRRDEDKERRAQVLDGAPVDRREFTYVYPWEVEPLALKPGDVLAFHAECLDHAGGLGSSGALALRVVKREELLDDLRRQFKLYSGELERLIKRQREVTTTTKLVRDRLLADPARDVAQENQPLQEVLANERDAGNSLQNLAEQVVRLANEMENNRLGSQTEYDHWRLKVAEPVAGVSKQLLGPLAAKLGEAQAATKATAAVEKLVGIINEQEDIEMQMLKIYAEMAAYGTWSEIVETMSRILEEARAAQKSIDEEFIRRIEEILRGGRPR